MNRTYIKDLSQKIGEPVLIKCWVDVRRDQGKMVFFDLRDMSGKVQGVVLPNHTEALEVAKEVRPEWVLAVTGQVNERPAKNMKEGVLNGNLELEIIGIEILNESETPPFELTDTRDISEEVRLKYRYLDLRTERMQNNLRTRHAIIKYVRDFLDQDGFIEVETPVLTKSTPEGARDYVVPSRLYPGKFYALPQSPQQYKQLLMVAGVEKYFQIARCFRDEDTRGDRQPEFTQMDLEASFVEREDIIQLNEKLLIGIVEKLFPKKRIQQKPFPRISYKEAVAKYGTDRPDIRENKDDPDLLAFCWVVDFPFFEKTDEGGWTFTHNPFSRAVPEHEGWLKNKENIGEIITSQYDVVLNGFEIGGGSIRNHQPELLTKVFEVIGFSERRIKENFGHMLEALSFGAPPHGGIAWGLDRLVALLLNEMNIREVIPFAKTGEGKDLMMDSPAAIEAKQLKELKIKLEK